MKLQRHHILYNRTSYESNKDLLALRNDSQLIVPLDSDTHAELHREICYVPTISHHLARRSLRLFNEHTYTDNHLKAIDNLQRSIETASKHPRADRIERGVADLAIHSLQIQKPFIDESLPTRLIRIA